MPDSEDVPPILTPRENAFQFSRLLGVILMLAGAALAVIVFNQKSTSASRNFAEPYALILGLAVGPGLVFFVCAFFLNRNWVAITGLVFASLYHLIALYSFIAWLMMLIADHDFKPMSLLPVIILGTLCIALIKLMVLYSRCTRVPRDPLFYQRGFEPLPVVPLTPSDASQADISLGDRLIPQIPPPPAADNQGK